MTLDLTRIKNNFNKYQSDSNDNYSVNLNKYKNPTDDTVAESRVYTGGNKYFNEKAGKYTGPEAYKNDQPAANPPTTGMSNKEKHAHYFKDTYKNDLKKYMNYSGDTTTNTTTSENNKIKQNVGNKGDSKLSIGDKNEFWHSNFNNDYSVNIAGSGDGFSNMQGSAAYTALNNNQHARSSSQLNGLKRASQASQEASRRVGGKERAANLYNSLGYSQNYWRQKADAQQNFYLGDIFAQKAPGYQLPEPPSDPMDKDTTQDTLNKFKDDLG